VIISSVRLRGWRLLVKAVEGDRSPISMRFCWKAAGSVVLSLLGGVSDVVVKWRITSAYLLIVAVCCMCNIHVSFASRSMPCVFLPSLILRSRAKPHICD